MGKFHSSQYLLNKNVKFKILKVERKNGAKQKAWGENFLQHFIQKDLRPLISTIKTLFSKC